MTQGFGKKEFRLGRFEGTQRPQKGKMRRFIVCCRIKRRGERCQNGEIQHPPAESVGMNMSKILREVVQRPSCQSNMSDNTH